MVGEYSNADVITTSVPSKKKKKSDRLSTSTASSISTREMQRIADRLELDRIRNTTKKNYQAVWRIFNKFIIKLDAKPDSWEERLTLFVAYMVNKKRQSRTIKSYISAIKATLKSNKIKIKEDKYLLASMTRACKLKYDKVKIRLPIHKQLLNKLLEKILEEFTGKAAKTQQPYLECLYRAMFATVYYGLFRIGEIAKGEHTILAKDVYLGENKRKLLFVLHTSKMHTKGDKPQNVKIAASRTSNQQFCPFKIIEKYMRIRKPFTSLTEPFFVFKDHSPVTPEVFRNLLKSLLTKLGEDSEQFNCHSFRIGRSQDLSKLGVSIELIRILGRWSTKSNVVYTYLK